MAHDTRDLQGAAEVLERGTREARELTKELFKDAVKNLGEILGDQVQHWRFRRAMELREKTLRILTEKGIEPRTVDPKLLVGIVDAGSLEIDEDLHDKWARLLASASSGVTIPPSYITILKGTTAAQAKLLDALLEFPPRKYESIRLQSWRVERPGVPWTPETRIKKRNEFVDYWIGTLGVTEEGLQGDIQELLRQGLIEIGDHPDDPAFRLTSSGRRFVEACRGPRLPEGT